MNVTKKDLKSRAKAFLMAMVLVLGLSGQVVPLLSVTAYATTNDIFDIVKNDGTIDSGNDIIQGGTTDNSIITIITKYKTIAAAIMGILAVTMLIFMLLQIGKLGAAGDNEMNRRKAIMGILTTGIATALLGGASVVVGFFWGALTGP